VPGYESFAAFYDAVQGTRAAHADYVAQLVERYRPGAGSVLELACGTGSVLARLRDRYEVTGVDLSPEMLAIARQKLPEVDLVEADMSRARLGRHFDAVLCVYDSINHLLSFRRWEATFATARVHLRPGGVFVFDVNTPARLAWLSEQQPVVQWFDGNLLVMDVVAGRRGAVDWRVRVFEQRRASEYRLHEETIPEIAFPLDRIREALAGRFRRVHVFDRQRARPSAHSGRLWFACVA
jgi:SAM-dependent methyltransferase